MLDTWETLVVSMSNSTPNGVLSLSQVTSSLLHEETRRKPVRLDNAQITEKKGRTKSKGPKGSRGRGRYRGKSHTRKKSGKCFIVAMKTTLRRISLLGRRNKRKPTIRRRMELRTLWLLLNMK